MDVQVPTRRHGRPTLDQAVAIREGFLNEAFVMLSERGVHGFSMDALAKASGVTKRTIYRQYESKMALIEAVVEREVLRLSNNDGLSDEGEVLPLNRLRRWARRLFGYLSRQDTQRLALLLRVASLTEPWAAEMLGVWSERLLDSGRLLVVASQNAGELRDCDPQDMIELLLDLIDRFSNRKRHLTGEAIAGAPNPEHWFDRRWRAFLHLARPDWSRPIAADDQ
ncbi:MULTISPECIES: TetR/AcrR family transcriptional regulator [unclassified Sphingomonas]|uniref:TetR/AcrR family transcriptional regulator n=1 Tax=unclassified Sphingomonas TaxID=196159 RepID=UPI00226AB885|nr:MULTISPECIES: TetR/AcrR family transcriptional regulator [unclassified Sphingomonas]